MKLFKIKWSVLSIGVLLLAACSGGGGSTSANRMSITTTDASGTQTTFVATSANSMFSAYTNTTENKTVVEICSDVDHDNDCSKLMIMTIDGTTAQKYAMDSIESLSQIVYHDDDPETGVTNHYISNSGEIKVNSIDITSGGTVKGAFNATLECNSGCTGTVGVTGNYYFVLNQ